MDKEIFHKVDARERILRGVDMISDPVRQTLGPKGGNVLFQGDLQQFILTNDGVTIAKQITSTDEVENAAIEVIKDAALRTNAVAGDGTTTSIIMSQVLVKEGLKYVENGYHPRQVGEEFLAFGKKLKKALKRDVIQVRNDQALFDIAKISANNDEQVAKDVVQTIKVAGLDGMVFVVPNKEGVETKLEEEVGFKINSGILYPELLQEQGKFSVNYEKVPVLITDKKIYYPEEAESILRTAVRAGHKSIVIVARDFMGECISTFIANHTDGVINVLLIKDTKVSDTDNVSLQDLAVYLKGKIVSEKTGNLVDRITADDFVIVKRVFSDPTKTLFTPTDGKKNRLLTERVKAIKQELAKDKENKSLKARLSSLTTGIVTVKVGGSTPLETNERIFRFEDAINSVRAAKKDGYLVGGGISLLNAFNPKDYSPEFLPIYKKFCESSIRQIAENCGKHPESVIDQINSNRSKYYGYNALTDTYEDLLLAGVIDPYMVTEMSIDNAISVANILTSVNYYIINVPKKDDKDT